MTTFIPTDWYQREAMPVDDVYSFVVIQWWWCWWPTLFIFILHSWWWLIHCLLLLLMHCCSFLMLFDDDDDLWYHLLTWWWYSVFWYWLWYYSDVWKWHFVVNWCSLLFIVYSFVDWVLTDILILTIDIDDTEYCCWWPDDCYSDWWWPLIYSVIIFCWYWYGILYCDITIFSSLKWYMMIQWWWNVFIKWWWLCWWCTYFEGWWLFYSGYCEKCVMAS